MASDPNIYAEGFTVEPAFTLISTNEGVVNPALTSTSTGGAWYRSIGANYNLIDGAMRLTRPGDDGGISSVMIALDESLFVDGAGSYSLMIDYTFANDDAARLFADVWDVDYGTGEVAAQMLRWGPSEDLDDLSVTGDATARELVEGEWVGPSNLGLKSLEFVYDGAGDIIVRVGNRRNNNQWSRVDCSSIEIVFNPVPMVDAGSGSVTWIGQDTLLTGSVSGEGITSTEYEFVIDDNAALMDHNFGEPNLSDYSVDPDLLVDFIGTFVWGTDGDPLTIVLSGLDAGNYTWTSYHHDGLNKWHGWFDLFIDTVKIDSIPVSGLGEPLATISSTFVADGVNPVKITLEYSPEGEVDWAQRRFVMNGFELTANDVASPNTLMVDFDVDGETDTAPGYLSYAAPNDPNVVVPADFGPQSYTLASMSVTVDPEWGPGAAGFATLTQGGTLMDPTAIFNGVVRSDSASEGYQTYKVQLVATSTFGQSVDEIDIDVLVDDQEACIYAQTIAGGPISNFDTDADCDIDLADFAAFAAEWLKDLVPYVY